MIENAYMFSCVFSSTGILATGSYTTPSYIKFWDPISGTLLNTQADKLDLIFQISFSSTGLLAVAGLNGEIVIYSL